MATPKRHGYPVTTCRCGKQAYKDRSEAKAARVRLHLPTDQRPYRCKIDERYYHLGHLSDDIIAGHKTREVYEMEDPEQWAREAVRLRSHGLCEVCGGRGYEYSHRQTRAVGDHKWCPCNGVNACRSCHAAMHSSPGTARSEGLHVSRFANDPSRIPVHLSVGWCLLACDGGGKVLKDAEVVVEYGIPALVTPTQ
jgi:hypothetical protein